MWMTGMKRLRSRLQCSLASRIRGLYAPGQLWLERTDIVGVARG